MEHADALLERLGRRLGLRPWMPIIVAEIIGDRVARAVAEKPTIAPPKPVTRVVDLREVLAERELDLLDLRTGGRMHEAVLTSSSPNYSVKLVADGLTRLRRSFREVQSLSPYLETVSAFENNGVFVLHLKDYSWVSSLHFSVVPHEPLVFHAVFIKYDVYA
ncbi:MAG: hypothetical protein QXM08_00605 [Thermofilaceae archaeon]